MDRIAKAAVSAVILSLLAWQAAASFGLTHRYRYWPFLSYPMYARPHIKGEPVSRFSLVGIDAEGGEFPIKPEDLQLDFWRYLRGPVRAAQRGEARALLTYLEHFEHRKGLRLSSVRLENHPIQLKDGRLTDLPVESSLIVVRNR